MKTFYRWVIRGREIIGGPDGARYRETGHADTPEEAGEEAGDWAGNDPWRFGECDLEVYEITETLLTKARLQGGKIVVRHLPINSQK